MFFNILDIMINPFANFYRVPTSQELLDIAFSRAMKSSAAVSKNAPKILKARKKEIKRIQVAIKEIIDRILKIIKMVPIIQEIPEFYRELASLIVNTDELRLSLGKLNGILPILSKIEKDYKTRIKNSEIPKEIAKYRRAVFGRISSIINKQKKSLNYLNEIRGELRRIPSIDYEIPSIVIAGYPNVGKSSLVRLISSGKPDVQPYPFTTKKIIIGHHIVEKNYDMTKLQIIDTPGILDRPMSKRNKIELQAILALNLISDVIIFIFDPTPACGYDIDCQVDLYYEICDNFSKDGKIPIIIVFNKMDLANEEEIQFLKNKLNLNKNDFFLINALIKDENVEELLEFVINKLT